MEERIKRLREMGMLVKIYHGRLKNPSEHYVPWKSQRRGEGAPASLRGPMVAPVSRPGFMVEDGTTEWG